MVRETLDITKEELVDIFDSHIHKPIDRRDSPTSIGNIGEPGGNDLAADSAA